MGPRPTVPAPGGPRPCAQPLAAAAVLAAVALWGVAAGAQAPGDPTISAIDGTCGELTVGPDDYSSVCKGTVLVVIGPGRIQTIFSTEDGRGVVFSGDVSRAELKPGFHLQPIDIVRTGYHEADLRSFDVFGWCVVSTPDAGQGSIECYAESGDAAFAALLTLDPSPAATTP